jgi:putative intracellular protease/amidase
MRSYRSSYTSALIAMALVGMIDLAALTLPAGKPEAATPPAPTDVETIQRQAEAFVRGMKPRGPGRPVIAILATNDGTEITDFLLPHAVLRRADVADVQAVAPRRGRVSMYPALEVEVAQDFADFERAHPSGADYVIVPAMMDDDDPAITTWLKEQSEKGARIIGICAGALVVGNAGLLDGRRAVTHWYSVDTLVKRHPTAQYVPDQRYVVDRDVATTTGVTASVPTMLALVEAIAGREKAQALATELGVDSWGPGHDSSLFGLTFGRGANFLLNKMAFWRDERWYVDVRDGMDDIALAFATDAWSRTGHISVTAAAAGPVKLRSGMVLVAQPGSEDRARLPVDPTLKPTQQLDRTLCEIGERFGSRRRDWVAIELEYARASDACPN